MSTAVLWFRRDLRLGDNPALLTAIERAGAGGEVVPLFVDDPALSGPAGAVRKAFLGASLHALDEAMGGALVVRRGDPASVLPKFAKEVEAAAVVAAADFGPYGRARDQRVEAQVGIEWVGSPYAVDPGAVRKGDGTPFQVFTPFHRAWTEHGWDPPAERPARVPWARGVPSDGVPTPDVPDGVSLPKAGEAAALARLEAFVADGAAAYDAHRNFPGEPGTSGLSPYLKWGLVHPRTIIEAVKPLRGKGAQTFVKEVAWREFYADVLFHRPESARQAWQPKMAGMQLDAGKRADERFQAWCDGRTGYPIVDAGMRQLRATGWMHNRVRMITASFLVKDLHIDWTRGARWFMQWLVDGDIASNQHGWQWVAGTGTDAAPYFRIFNPVSQGKKFDPDGDYVRQWVPELQGLSAKDIHAPWEAGRDLLSGGHDYPDPIVDHAVEREEALARYQRLRNG